MEITAQENKETPKVQQTIEEVKANSDTLEFQKVDVTQIKDGPATEDNPISKERFNNIMKDMEQEKARRLAQKEKFDKFIDMLKDIQAKRGYVFESLHIPFSQIPQDVFREAVWSYLYYSSKVRSDSFNLTAFESMIKDRLFKRGILKVEKSLYPERKKRCLYEDACPNVKNCIQYDFNCRYRLDRKTDE